MNTIGAFARSYVDALSIAFSPHVQHKKHRFSRDAEKIAARAAASGKPVRTSELSGQDRTARA
jgi:predicted RNA-binding protein Jag